MPVRRPTGEIARLTNLLDGVVRRALEEELQGQGTALSWYVLNDVAPQMARAGAHE